MEDTQTQKIDSPKNDVEKTLSQQRTPFLFPLSSSVPSTFSSIPTHKGIIITICMVMLVWMILQWDYENNFQDIQITGKSQETTETLKIKLQHSIENVEALLNSKNNKEYKLDMPNLIEQALSSLKKFTKTHFKMEEGISSKIFSDAKGIVFLSSIKGGGGISGELGTGIVIARDENQKWTGPCAIALAGVGIGLIIGIEKADHIIILKNDDSVRVFESFGQFQLGLDFGIAFGLKGRDISPIFSVGNKGYSTMISHSTTKGIYLGLSLESHVITIRNDCNEEYYGKKIEARKILDGSVQAPNDKNLDKLFQLLANASNLH